MDTSIHYVTDARIKIITNKSTQGPKSNRKMGAFTSITIATAITRFHSDGATN